MKKTFYFFTKTLLVFSLLFLTSCEDDKLKGKISYLIAKPNHIVSRPDGIVVEFTDHFNVNVKYKDASGKIVTEEGITLPWEKSFIAVAPYKAEIEMSFSLKNDVVLPNELCEPGNLLRMFIEAEGVRMRPTESSINENVSSNPILSYDRNINSIISKGYRKYTFDFTREKLDWWKRGAGVQ
ncbi:hypothetical protein [Dysgonomonas sp. 520]|uniref:hypothetical protein n=1 Tax=Dysgonomonas sp. 520 TaxID=2302931 RepID=UPI0013D4F881|nr:hypothetical protein [Dysgonomonas sp. 520]NDW09573.1 hypothetical protein [Dysgonomonas sp. 520]